MSYAEYQATQSYNTKKSGANIEIVLVDEADTSQVILGAASGNQFNDNFETNAVEEAGNDGVDEHTQGRHDGSGTLQGFWTPAWNDALPTRQSFINRGFVLFEKIPQGREGAGTVLNAFVGVKLNRFSSPIGARGNRTMDTGYVYTRRYNGQEWATLTGVA